MGQGAAGDSGWGQWPGTLPGHRQTRSVPSYRSAGYHTANGNPDDFITEPWSGQPGLWSKEITEIAGQHTDCWLDRQGNVQLLLI